MTNEELIQYYANLLILQYRGKPKAYATVQALVEMVTMDQLPILVQEAFTLGSAVGVQLDTIGKYLGVSRYGYNFTGAITLSDPDFTSLIRMAIIRNASGSSLYDIQALLALFFPDIIRVFDHQNMRMSYYYNSTLGSSDLAQIFVKDGLLPKPMGVQLASLIYAPDIDHFYGFRTYQHAGVNNSPWNSYTDYQTNRPWLRYSDAIIT